MEKTRLIGGFIAIIFLVTPLTADPLSKSKPIDFYRDVTSRHLQGTATRSDGHLLNGPDVKSLETDLGADLLWSLSPDGDNLLIGTGPHGRILTVNPDDAGKVTTKVVLELPESHIFAVKRLPDGLILAGTSPEGSLVLARDGVVLARATLPVGSILDLLVMPTKKNDGTAVLVATGSPGRIYRLDIEQMLQSGIADEKLTTAEALAAHGVVLWGSVRDDNIRRLLQIVDGRIVAGSAPKGNVYIFPASGGAPGILAENESAEVSDLLPWENGFYAAITFTLDPRESRVNPARKPAPKSNDTGEEVKIDTAPVALNQPTPAPQFRGRGQLIWFPDGGYPEVVATQNNTAFYSLVRHDDIILIAGGEEGELIGYDPRTRQSLTFPGVTASQLNAMLPAQHPTGAFYAIGNNPSSLEKIDFTTAQNRVMETKRLDLGVPARIGSLRFDGPVNIPVENFGVELRASFSSDQLEGWGEWQSAQPNHDSWQVPDLHGRYFQVRFTLPSGPFELASAQLYYLPQNHRPQLQSFQVLTPNFALIPAASRPQRQNTKLGQIVKGSGVPENKERDEILNSEVIPQPGTQIVFWDANDSDGDNLLSTFSIKASDSTDWTDLVIDSPDHYAQFEISHLAEGLYRTRLKIEETEPRSPDQRLSTTFETDNLVVDRTSPEILEASVSKSSGGLELKLRARDDRSLLRGIEVKFNNGLGVDLEDPVDGILDNREETFRMVVPAQQISGSTAVEIVVLDATGNSSARRLTLPLDQ
jgi:hypothetical protein